MAFINVPNTFIPIGQGSGGNSTSRLLKAGEIFIGTFEDVINYSYISCNILTNSPSAISGMVFQWSNDNNSIIYEETVTIYTNLPKFYNISPRTKFFRIKYLNGNIDQTIFNMQVYYHSTGSAIISLPLEETVTLESYAQLTQSAIMGRIDDHFVNIEADINGNLFVKHQGDITISNDVATSANQTSELTKLDTIHSDLITVEGKHDTTNSSLSSINNKLNTLGQKSSSSSIPIVIANDQIVPVSGAFYQTTQPISAASLPLPTNAATSALQTSGNISLSNIDIKTPALGQTTMALSSPVVIASNQSSIPVAATLSAETNKIIGTINISSAQTLANVTTVGTISNALPIGNNTIGAVTNTNLDVALSTRLKPTDTLSGITTVSAVTAITNALPAGTNLLGKISIDQTTPGTTNLVSAGQNGTWNINNVSGIVSLPTGASTSANQTTEITHLTALDTHVDINLSTRSSAIQQYQRPSQMNSRTHVSLSINAVTINTVIKTVTVGKIFYLTSVGISSTGSGASQINISDSNTSVKIPILVLDKSNILITQSFPEPIPFLTNIIFKVIAGSPTTSVWIVGYEE